MYSYTKQMNTVKKRFLIFLSCVLIIGATFICYQYYGKKKERESAVFHETKVPVLTLPNMQQKAILPFDGEVKTVLEYFDGKDHDVSSISKFEGVYRANQGIDYAKNDEAFDVLSIYGGNVVDVKNDELFGNTITIKSEDTEITYQSLSDIKYKKGDSINQKDVIGKAGKNIYNKELGNHVHVVVEKQGKIVDPKTIYGKPLRNEK